jgi:putative glutathione S-transferase
VLWDRAEDRIASNNSAEILRLLNALVLGAGPALPALYPRHLRAEMDARQARDLDAVAAGVYAIGGASDQGTYEAAVRRVFDALDRIEDRLVDGRSFLHGDEPLASDVLLLTPAVRFDLVYGPIFRARLKRFRDYPALGRWLERMLDLPGVAATVRPGEILAHYDDDEWAPRCPSIMPLEPGTHAS